MTGAGKRRIKARLIRWYGACHYCGVPIRTIGDATLDHFFPRADGGADAVKNLVLACYRCNQSKGCRRPRPEEYKGLNLGAYER